MKFETILCGMDFDHRKLISFNIFQKQNRRKIKLIDLKFENSII